MTYIAVIHFVDYISSIASACSDCSENLHTRLSFYVRLCAMLQVNMPDGIVSPLRFDKCGLSEC